MQQIVLQRFAGLNVNFCLVVLFGGEGYWFYVMCLLSNSFSVVGKDLVTVSVSQWYAFTEEIQRFPFFSSLDSLDFVVVFCLSSCHLRLKTL